jgi:hypothetical protein
MNKIKVYLAILNEGTIRSELCRVKDYWQSKGDYDIYLSYPDAKPIEDNRNRIVQNFLKTDCEWLVQIDDDIVPPLNYLDLILYNKDIITGVCYAYRQDSLVPLILKRSKKNELWENFECNSEEGLIEVDSVGTGAIIINRRVFTDKLKNHPFESIWNEDGTRKKGLDLYFCEKAKAEGFEVWCHLKYVCSHIVDMDLAEVSKGFIVREINGGAIDNNFRMRRVDAQTPPSKRKRFVTKKTKTCISTTLCPNRDLSKIVKPSQDLEKTELQEIPTD